ncbi:TLC domain-containing protein At5g14285-like [Mercurialis annua]|uniref:TLC domain-containing protein At5g14285-like n=1 Tax=Mercurialis annua TaxID=3986 RepID=UPI00215F5651|nr:TLC domain-containing protein At5g14285-like [Mercurialis annua]
MNPNFPLISGFSKMETLIQSLPLLPLFFTFFLSIYLIAQFIVFRNWPAIHRLEASSCLISLFHGTPAAIFASYYAVFNDVNRTHTSFSSPNTPAQNSVLDFSIAYFLMDLIHYLIFFPSDVLFIGHHLGTLFVFITCRYFVSHGAFAILSLLVLAEITSFCQNAWTLARARRGDVKFAAKVYHLLSPPFYAFYSVVRGFLGPWFVYEMGRFYISGGADSVIPKWVWVSWMIVVIMAISVSILWIVNLWVELYRERKLKFGKKLS